MNGFQVDQNCNGCANGTHQHEGKCVANTVGCSKKTLASRTVKVDNSPTTISGNCAKCAFWYWSTVNDNQGNYCVNRWWMWVIIIISGIIGLSLLVSAIGFFTCCDDCCSKKRNKKSSKAKDGEIIVQNKKAKAEKKKEGGCCGGDKKKKGEESYDKGYEKAGFCDCMCCANICGGCLGACGCTCSKCCRKKDRYVSGYGLGSQHNF